MQQGSLSETPAWLEIMERSVGVRLSKCAKAACVYSVLQFVESCRFGAFEPNKGKAPKQIQYDEDRLYQAYMAKHPEVCRQHEIRLVAAVCRESHQP